MINVVLHNDPLGKGKTVSVAEHWDEITGEQLADIAGVLFTPMDKQIALAHLVRILLKMSPAQFRKIDTEVVIENLTFLTEWITEATPFTSQLLPVFKAGRHRYYGPCSGMDNITNVEFDFAEREMYLWHQDKSNLKPLYRFVACLYRPAKKGYDHKLNPEGDCREIFNDNLLAYYADHLQEYLPVKYAYAVMLWYKGCRQQMMQQHPRIFNPNTDSGSAAGGVPSYFGLMMLMAEKQTFGSFDEVERMLFCNTLAAFEHYLDKQAEIESQRKKHNQHHTHGA